MIKPANKFPRLLQLGILGSNTVFSCVGTGTVTVKPACKFYQTHTNINNPEVEHGSKSKTLKACETVGIGCEPAFKPDGLRFTLVLG